MKKKTALDTRPKRVAIVALGPSNHDFVSAKSCKKNALQVDETWLINSALGTFTADKVFIMDKLETMQQRYPEWSAKLKHTTTPIITCYKTAGYPTSLSYPKDEVCAELQDDYFTNSVAYAIAYAIYIGSVEELYLFGADFWYPGSDAVESGAECCAYWLGVAKERGINYRLPKSSTLLDAHLTKVVDGRVTRPMYGYDFNPGEMHDKVRRGTASKQEALLAKKTPKLRKPPKQRGKGNGIYHESPPAGR